MKHFFTKLFNRKLSIPTRMTFIVMGIASTVWFLVRVIPKPQRAGYPCMRTAAPIMSGFFIYILSMGGSVLLFRKAFANLKKAKYWSAIAALFVSVILLAIFNLNDVKSIYANTLGIQWTRGVLPDAPNTPMGTPWGIFPGRVAWTWSPNATNENCTNTTTDSYLLSKNSNQDTINKLANKAILLIGGKATVKDSWDAIFKSFNNRKSGTESSYVTGQTIFIKINNGQAGWAINPSDLSETAQGKSVLGVGNYMANTSPQAVAAFLYQLVDSFGIAPENIMIAEPMTHVYKSMRDMILSMPSKYANIKILDKENHTDLGRTTTSGWKAKAIVYSDKAKVMTAAGTDAIMNEMYNADYVINIAALKAHARGGVTLTAKNNFGSHGVHSGNWDSFHLHNGLISTVDNDVFTSGVRGDYHMYRVLTDLMGNEKLGRNTVLFIVDGLWGGIEATDMPVKWKTAPFNNDWPSSLFVAQDEIALQSVCLDFLRAEADKNTAFKDRPFFPAVDDFLHQGATKANWPDSIKNLGGKWFPFAGYDPEGDGTFMPSLGVHEHWNNATDKQYSRDLYSNGTGIDLMTYPSNLVARSAGTALNLTVSVTDGGNPLSDAIVIVNGSNYLTDADGKAIIGNLKSTSGLAYTIKKKGYSAINGTVDVTADAQVSEALTSTTPGTVVNTSSLHAELSAYPNPCSTETSITFQLRSSSHVSLFLIATNGAIVRNIYQRELSAGIYNNKINVQNLKSGIYICVLNTSEGIKTIKLKVK